MAWRNGQNGLKRWHLGSDPMHLSTKLDMNTHSQCNPGSKRHTVGFVADGMITGQAEHGWIIPGLLNLQETKKRTDALL